MSRVTHDFECSKCGTQGKVLDDAITCPECGESIEGQALTVEALEALMKRSGLDSLPREVGVAEVAVGRRLEINRGTKI